MRGMSLVRLSNTDVRVVRAKSSHARPSAAVRPKTPLAPLPAHKVFGHVILALVVLLVMVSMIIGGYRKARRHMLTALPSADTDVALMQGLAEFRLAFILALVAYNVTEATFKAVHPSFFLSSWFRLSAVPR